MLYIILSIICNTLLFVILKLFDRFGISTLAGIVTNYFVAAALGFLFYTGSIRPADLPSQPWFIYALSLGVLFVSIFLLLARTAQTAGVSVASVANKMSVVIPVMAAFIFLHDRISLIKIAGIVLALAAVYLVSKKETQKEMSARALLLSFTVFLGSGIIDTLVSYTSKTKLAAGESAVFVSLCFAVAGAVGVLILILQRVKIKLADVLGGIVLGIPNYFSIYTLIKALDGYGQASVVLPVINVGIVLLSALSGLALFREKFSVANCTGIALAVIAIIMISMAEGAA